LRTIGFVHLITFLGLLLTLSLVMPKVYGAGPMDTEPSAPVTGSTTTAGPIVCENKQQEPTAVEKCRTSAGVYMGFDKDGNLVFSSNLGEALTGGNLGAISGERTAAVGGKIFVYSVVQKGLEEKKKDIQYGMFVGYDAGLNDGLSGRPSNPASGRDALGEAFNAGYKLGYPDGYAAGVSEKSFKGVH
jgi:hypothetical protein